METAKLLAEFAEVTRQGLLIADVDGLVRHINPAAAAIFGYSPEELVEKPVTMIIPERLRGAHAFGMGRVLAGNETRHGGKPVEVMGLRKDATEVPVEITLSVWHSNSKVWAGAMVRDVSERREKDARLLRLATRDTVTGLPNKQAFVTLAREENQKQPCAIHVLDLDGFREINDLYGLVVADTLIEAVGVRLSHFVTEGVSIARLGDDEFAILQSGMENAAEAVEMAEGVLQLFSKPFRVNEMEFHLSCSIGISVAQAGDVDVEETLASADFALQKVKKQGGRSYLVYDQAMSLESTGRRTIRNELRCGLKRNELQLFYQPQFDLTKGHLVGFEVLLRWQHPVQGLLSPAAFLPALDRSILALDVGWFTLDEACRVGAQINRSGHKYTMAVNLFPQQFQAPDLCARVRAALDKYGVPAELLELELTEQIALDDLGKGVGTLQTLRQMGVGIAVDDFGTGFASLNSLQKLPLSALKIDKSFVQHIHQSPSDRAITRALVSMSRELGLKTVAEGIETKEQEAALVEIGCALAQEFRYGRPQDEAATMNLVQGSSDKTFLAGLGLTAA